MVYPNNGILLGDIIELIINTCNIDESQDKMLNERSHISSPKKRVCMRWFHLYKITKNADKSVVTKVEPLLPGTGKGKGREITEENIFRGMDMFIVFRDDFSCQMSKLIELYI